MAVKASKALVTQHVSIVKDWQDCPVVKCTKCCRWVRASEGQYHCPLCPVSVYPPSTKDRLQKHLQEHQRDAITCADWHILQCHMKCGGVKKPHFHCLYCAEVIVKREAAQAHIRDCTSLKQGSKQENMPETSDTNVTTLDSEKDTSSDPKTSGHPTVKCNTQMESETSVENQGNDSPTKRSQSLPAVSPGDSPVKRRRGRPPSATKAAGRPVGRPRGKQQDAGEDSSPNLGQQLKDLLDQTKREDVNNGEIDGRREEEVKEYEV